MACQTEGQHSRLVAADLTFYTKTMQISIIYLGKHNPPCSFSSMLEELPMKIVFIHILFNTSKRWKSPGSLLERIECIFVTRHIYLGILASKVLAVWP